MPTERRKPCMPSPLSFLDKVANLEKKQGCRIIRFDLAEPMFAPPPDAIESTISAIRAGKFKYAPSRGLPELIAEVRAFLSNSRGLSYSDREVLITTGGKFANYAFFSSLFKMGDGIILLKPYWTSFGAVPEMLGLKKIEVWSNEPYHLDQERLLDAMSKHPRAIVINTPNNPTGGMFNDSDIKLLHDLAVDHDLLVLSDEIDWAYSYDGRKHISPASIEGLRERTIVTDGFSKVFSMTGWRVGFAAGPERLINKMHDLQEHSLGSPTTFSQYGCVAALEASGKYIPQIQKLCASKRNEAMQALGKIDSISCPLPEGGFYVYPLVKDGEKDPTAISTELLEKAGVSTIPGTFFGDTRGTFRLCYAVDDQSLVEGLKRIAEYFSQH